MTTRDQWVAHQHGRLFTRVWQPPDPAGGHEPGSPIVLLHDSLGCVELWRGFPALLAAGTGRSVIGYDRLGFGRSDPHPGRLGLDFIADEATTYFPTVREQLGLDSFLAFGHSVGGGMAVHLAAAAGATCEAVITESAQAFVEDRTTTGIRHAQQAFTHAHQFSRLTKYHGDKAGWVLHAWTDTWLDPAFATWSLRTALPQVTSPLLAIHGSLDEYGSTRHPELITELAGGPTQLQILDSIHHVPHREAEAHIIDLVTTFTRDPGRT